MLNLLCLHIIPHFKPGDPPPTGYVEWHEWAKVQGRAGLRQRKCWRCGLWRFPQEVCCGPEPMDLPKGFTVDDVIAGRVKLAGPMGEKAKKIIERHRKKRV